MTRALALYLADKPIGRLFIEGSKWVLDLDRDYVDSTPRPVLGQAFEDLDLRQRHGPGLRRDGQ